MAVWRINNFSRGFAQDATFIANEPVLRNLENYKLVYTGDKVTLRVRSGMSAFNSTALANPATQLEVFTDLSGNENILGITTTKWYAIKASGVHVLVSNDVATAQEPIATFGDRFIFGTTSNGLRWTDNSAIAGSPSSFVLGIEPPTNGAAIEKIASIGNEDIPADSAPIIELNTTTRKKIAYQFTIPANTEVWIRSVYLSLQMENPGNYPGSFKVSIYTDDTGPSTTLADLKAVSNWVYNASIAETLYPFIEFPFPELFKLTTGGAITTFWIVLEGNDYYYGFYNKPVFPTGFDFYLYLGKRNVPPHTLVYGVTAGYNVAVSGWVTTGTEGLWYFSSLQVNKFYDYVYTFYNSTYGIESRPSDNARVATTTTKGIMYITDYDVSGDIQANKVRFYRREVPALDSIESAITDTYKFVCEQDSVITPDVFYDTLRTEDLGAELQTQDHYSLTYTDEDSDSQRKVAIHPYTMCMWKDRIWLAEADGNILYMSKILEEDGATGYTGKAIPDYFPLDNKLEIEEASGIIALRQLTDDQLVVYFKNGSIWIVEGGNEVYNPPGDLSKRQVLTTTGLLAQGALDGMRGSHIYLAQEGVHAFTGSSTPNYLSQEIQTILDAIQTSYLDDSILTCFGDELWLLVDTDNDGYKDTIFILNVQKSVPAWRRYTYPFKFNDIVVRPTGSTFKTVLAADAVNNYIYQLEYGTTDNGQPIATEIETHNFAAADRLTIMGVELDAYYPKVPAAYDVIVRNSIGNEYKYLIQPGSSEDIRGHRTGCRVTTGPNARVKVQSRSVNEDELLSLAVIFQER